MDDTLIVSLATGVAVPILTMIINLLVKKRDNSYKKISESIQSVQDDVSETKELAKRSNRGTRDLAKYRLLKDMEKYIERGSITSKELEDITMLFRSYSDVLGGNGAVSDMYKRFYMLPIKDKGGEKN